MNSLKLIMTISFLAIAATSQTQEIKPQEVKEVKQKVTDW